MKQIKRIDTRHNIILLYENPVIHSVESAATWTVSVIRNADGCDRWIELKDTHNSADDGDSSIPLPADANASAILNEIANKEIDSILIGVLVSSCRVSIAINIHSFVISVGVQKKDEKMIHKIEPLLSSIQI